jgi:hypothetical protein
MDNVNNLRPTTIADCPPIGYHCLKDFEDLGPAIWRGIHLDLTIPKSPSSKAQEIGTAVHALVLEGLPTLEDRYVVLPDGEWESDQRKIAQEVVAGAVPHVLSEPINRRTKIGKEQWSLALEAAAGRRIVSAEDMAEIAPLIAAYKSAVGRKILSAAEMAIVLRMGNAVGQSPDAMKLLDGAETEKEMASHVSVSLPQGVVNVPIRGRLDALHEVVSDLKSCDDLTTFDRSVVKFGYHRQLAHYDLLRRHNGGPEDLPAYWIAVEVPASPLHPVRVEVIRCPVGSMEVGLRKNLATITKIAGAFASNQWSPIVSGVRDFALPPWAHFVE